MADLDQATLAAINGAIAAMSQAMTALTTVIAAATAPQPEPEPAPAEPGDERPASRVEGGWPEEGT